jgi:hypothetical protein
MCQVTRHFPDAHVALHIPTQLPVNSVALGFVHALGMQQVGSHTVLAEDLQLARTTAPCLDMRPALRLEYNRIVDLRRVEAVAPAH